VSSPSQVSRRSLDSTRKAGASRTTVLVALTANGLIAVAKLIGGVASGSTALLAEAAHSLADTTNQAFLLGSISLAAREPTERHPFGHGNQRFLWTFVAAVGMFVAGAVFAVGYGVLELVSGSKEEGGFAAAWMARIDVADGVDGDHLERAMSDLDDAVRQAVPDVTEVFLDPTPGRRQRAGHP
jgi:divalent metal cation (Fe/Co/Zn/Cd) transporter